MPTIFPRGIFRVNPQGKLVRIRIADPLMSILRELRHLEDPLKLIHQQLTFLTYLLDTILKSTRLRRAPALPGTGLDAETCPVEVRVMTDGPLIERPLRLGEDQRRCHLPHEARRAAVTAGFTSTLGSVS